MGTLINVDFKNKKVLSVIKVEDKPETSLLEQTSLTKPITNQDVDLMLKELFKKGNNHE